MDDKMLELLAGEFAKKIMIRIFRMETQEEKEAYMLGIEDFKEFTKEMFEAAENNAEKEEQSPESEDEIQKLWESRMMFFDEMDGDTFSFYINRQIFGDDR